jgi:hypothetical protein
LRASSVFDAGLFIEEMGRRGTDATAYPGLTISGPDMGDRRFGVCVRPGPLAVTTNLSIKLLVKEALPSFWQRQD